MKNIPEGIKPIVDVLPVYSEEKLSGISLHGRALSRTDNTIQVATQYGIIEVKINSIVAVQAEPQDPTIVTLQVSDSANAKVIAPIRSHRNPLNIGWPPRLTNLPLPGKKGWLMPDQFTPVSETWTKSNCEDTATTSGTSGGFDSTDDHICDATSDDRIG